MVIYRDVIAWCGVQLLTAQSCDFYGVSTFTDFWKVADYNLILSINMDCPSLLLLCAGRKLLNEIAVINGL